MVSHLGLALAGHGTHGATPGVMRNNPTHRGDAAGEHDPRRREEPAQPERELAAAVFACAIDDLRLTAGIRHHERASSIRRDARQFFESIDVDWPYSFVNLCGVLGLEPDAVRAKLRAKGLLEDEAPHDGGWKHRSGGGRYMPRHLDGLPDYRHCESCGKAFHRPKGPEGKRTRWAVRMKCTSTCYQVTPESVVESKPCRRCGEEIVRPTGVAGRPSVWINRAMCVRCKEGWRVGEKA